MCVCCVCQVCVVCVGVEAYTCSVHTRCLIKFLITILNHALIHNSASKTYMGLCVRAHCISYSHSSPLTPQEKEHSIPHDELGRDVASVTVLQRNHEAFENEASALGSQVSVHRCSLHSRYIICAVNMHMFVLW